MMKTERPRLPVCFACGHRLLTIQGRDLCCYVPCPNFGQGIKPAVTGRPHDKEHRGA